MRDWLDGPRLVDWLEEHFPETCAAVQASGGGRAPKGDRLGAHARALSRWRQGRGASVYAVDRWMTLVGLHISMIPDDLYLEESPVGGFKTFPEEFKAEVAAHPGPPLEVARKFSVSPDSVRNWRKAAA